MKSTGKFFREPLTQFLCAALVVFAVMELWPATDPEATIIVDEQRLARFLQSQEPSLTTQAALMRIGSMAPDAVQSLTTNYINQQVLVREARARGLDKNDHVLEQRLIQKMRFMLVGAEGGEEAPSLEVLQKYFAANQARYERPATLSFKHLFFANSGTATDSDNGGSALSRAEEQRKILLSGGSVNSDRFPYQRAYLDVSAEQISNHFGSSFAEQIFAMPAQPGDWQGPISSAYGLHLINLTSKHAARIPPFAEQLERVRSDFLKERKMAQENEAIAKLKTNYTVKLSLQANGNGT